MIGRPAARARSGITLTEILISILIMGVGMLSLATLFPLGLQRLREAARNSRSAMLVESAADEIESRDLLFKGSFAVNGYPFDPFTEDPASAAESTAINLGLDRTPNTNAYINLVNNGNKLRGVSGVPVCYDPLWWYQVFAASGGALTPNLGNGTQYRFGSGIGLVRGGPHQVPSAHGLQRITNFPLQSNAGAAPYTIDPVAVFCSPDDLVMQTDGTPDASVGRGSPIVPDLSNNGRVYDYSFTWIFTGRQTDLGNSTVFDGDIVIFHNRPFATEQLGAGSVNAASGERVVEAIWGYAAAPRDPPRDPYGANNRTVLLRWPTAQADPDVRVGGWIADVTYERFSGEEIPRFNPRGGAGRPRWDVTYPAQRCHWYRVVKRSEPTADHDPTLARYKQMIVTVDSDLRSKTPIRQLSAGGGSEPLHVEAALISPYVVNVVPKIFYSR